MTARIVKMYWPPTGRSAARSRFRHPYQAANELVWRYAVAFDDLRVRLVGFLGANGVP